MLVNKRYNIQYDQTIYYSSFNSSLINVYLGTFNYKQNV